MARWTCRQRPPCTRRHTDMRDMLTFSGTPLQLPAMCTACSPKVSKKGLSVASGGRRELGLPAGKAALRDGRHILPFISAQKGLSVVSCGLSVLPGGRRDRGYLPELMLIKLRYTTAGTTCSSAVLRQGFLSHQVGGVNRGYLPELMPAKLRCATAGTTCSPAVLRQGFLSRQVGDANRGYLLELMLTKLRYATAGIRREDVAAGEGVQIIGMSATMRQACACMVADWLGAQLYETTFRPVPLAKYIKVQTPS